MSLPACLENRVDTDALFIENIKWKQILEALVSATFETSNEHLFRLTDSSIDFDSNLVDCMLGLLCQVSQDLRATYSIANVRFTCDSVGASVT